MKIYAYLRVSTDKQADSGAGIAAQKDSCEKWANKNASEIAQFFVEEGVSGSTGLDKRPQLVKAINCLSKGDILIVAKRDRIARDPIISAMVEAAVERKKAKIVSAAGEGTDANGPSDILMRRLIDAFAEFERNIIKQRTKDALGAKKKRGERVGHIPFGWKLGEGKSIVVEEGEQKILYTIREMTESGSSTRDIANHLNVQEIFNRRGKRWNHMSMYNAVKNSMKLNLS